MGKDLTRKSISDLLRDWPENRHLKNLFEKKPAGLMHITVLHRRQAGIITVFILITKSGWIGRSPVFFGEGVFFEQNRTEFVVHRIKDIFIHLFLAQMSNSRNIDGIAFGLGFGIGRPIFGLKKLRCRANPKALKLCWISTSGYSAKAAWIGLYSTGKSFCVTGVY